MKNIPLVDLLWRKLGTCFAVDCRSLALYRVCISFATLCDLLERSFYLRAHYTNEGVMPRIAAVHFGNQYQMSVHMINDTVVFQALMFLVNAAFLLCVMVGWRTKLFTILSWFWVTSLQARNQTVLHGGDTIIKVAWFFAMYMPLETCFSIDSCSQTQSSKYDKGKSKSNTYFGLATIGYFIQLTFVYVTAYSEKASVKEWQLGDSTFYVLQLGYFATPIATFLLNFPRLVNIMTRIVLYWELIGPLLLYMPVFNQQLRLLGVLGLMAMHLGFASCLRLGVFTLCALSLLTAAFPPLVWDFLFQRLSTRERRQLAIYFDPASAMSRGLCKVLTTFCLIPGTLVYDLDDLTSISAKYDFSVKPWLLVTDVKNATYENELALITVFKHSPLFWWIPKIASNKLISKITHNLFSYFSPLYPDTPSPPPRSAARERLALYGKRIAMVAFVVAMTALIIHNGNPPWPEAIRFDFDILLPVLQVFRIDQQWIMFSRPPKNTMWLIMKGTLKDGTEVDIFKNQGLARWGGGEYNEEVKPNVHPDFLNHRWYKYFENGLPKWPHVRPHFTSWVCKEWNKRHDISQHLTKFSVTYGFESNPLDLDDGHERFFSPLYDDVC